jgi:hypothetical protein
MIKRGNRANILFFTALIIISLLSTLGLKEVLAQDISLSITPPITELMIMPGKETTQRYLLENSGNETIIKVYLATLSPSDEFGNIEINKDLKLYEFANVTSWFTLLEPQIKIGGSFLLPRGATKEIVLQISTPEDAPEGDYYFTLLFETDTEGVMGGKTLGAKATIASNILLTVSKSGRPEKDAEIAEFSAPIIVDSLGQLVYKTRIKNTGSAFFQPEGKIRVNPIFGNEEILTLAPQNILAASTRQIPCTADETLIRCSLRNRVLFGLYKADLKFKIEDEGETFTKSAYTVAFPFTIITGVIGALIVFKLIKKMTKR